MNPTALLSQLDSLNEARLRRLWVEHVTRQKLDLYWGASAIDANRHGLPDALTRGQGAGRGT